MEAEGKTVDPVTKAIYDDVKQGSPNSFQQVVLYIYSDQVDFKKLTTEEIADLVFMASALDLDRLVLIALNTMIKSVQVKEIVPHVRKFWKHNSTKFEHAREVLVKLAAKNYDELKPEIEKLAADLPAVVESVNAAKAKAGAEKIAIEPFTIPESTFKADMRRLFEGKAAPYDFQVGPIKCHKVILAARCPMFNAMLANNMRENTESKADSPLKESALRCFLHYLYTGETDQITSPEDAQELLEHMNYYFLDEEKYHEEFRTACEKVIEAANPQATEEKKT